MKAGEKREAGRPSHTWIGVPVSSSFFLQSSTSSACEQASRHDQSRVIRAIPLSSGMLYPEQLGAGRLEAMAFVND